MPRLFSAGALDYFRLMKNITAAPPSNTIDETISVQTGKPSSFFCPDASLGAVSGWLSSEGSVAAIVGWVTFTEGSVTSGDGSVMSALGSVASEVGGTPWGFRVLQSVHRSPDHV